MNESMVENSETIASTVKPERNPLKLRFPAICLLLFWVISLVVARLDKPYFLGFLYGLASTFLISVLFLGWWWFNRSLRLLEKAIGFLLLVGEALVVGKF